MISRRLAHQIQNRIQVILSTVEMEKPEKAVVLLRELSNLVNGHIESVADELQRKRWRDRD